MTSKAFEVLDERAGVAVGVHREGEGLGVSAGARCSPAGEVEDGLEAERPVEVDVQVRLGKPAMASMVSAVMAGDYTNPAVPRRCAGASVRP